MRFFAEVGRQTWADLSGLSPNAAHLAAKADWHGWRGHSCLLRPGSSGRFNSRVRHPDLDGTRMRQMWGRIHIGWSAGDCAPAPSHTTGRAVFRIRRLNPATLICGKS